MYFIAVLLSTAPGQSAPLNASSFAVLGAIVAAMRRRQAIGGWLFFMMWQVFVGLGVSILQAALDRQSYRPSTWNNSKLYLIFLVSFAPRFMTLFVITITCFMLLRTFDWRWAMTLQTALYVYIVCGAISLVLDYVYFPSSLDLAAVSLLFPTAMLLYIRQSQRFRRVFRTQDWRAV
jgi:hypothetical protein